MKSKFINVITIDGDDVRQSKVEASKFKAMVKLEPVSECDSNQKRVTSRAKNVSSLPKPSKNINDTTAISEDSSTSSSQKKRKTPFKSLKDMTNDCKDMLKDMEQFNQEIVAQRINTEDKDTNMVIVDDIVLKQKNLRCLTQEGATSYDKWVEDDVSQIAN